MVDFCFGGWIANMMAVRIPSFAAAVSFNSSQPAAEDVPAIQAPLQLHYADLDTRVTGGWPAYETALKANDRKFNTYVYSKVNHGFHNDTTTRYGKAAAELTWQRAIDFFKEKLG